VRNVARFSIHRHHDRTTTKGKKVLSVYAQRIYDAIQKDGFYVRVPSGKQFYLYVLQTIDRSDAVKDQGASYRAG
jgi:hypothetical protein